MVWKWNESKGNELDSLWKALPSRVVSGLLISGKIEKQYIAAGEA
jgi:RNAse (barnase) inhibitor barstar